MNNELSISIWKWKNIFEESKWSPRINHLIQKGWGGVKVNQQGWTSKRREVKVNVEMVFRNGKWKWKVNVEICLRNGSDVSVASALHSAGIITLLAVNFPGKRYHPLQLAWYAWGAKEMLVKIIKGCIRLNGLNAALWSVHGSDQIIDLLALVLMILTIMLTSMTMMMIMLRYWVQHIESAYRIEHQKTVYL